MGWYTSILGYRELHIFTRNPDVIQLIEQNFGIKIEERDCGEYRAYVYSGSILNGRDQKQAKIASRIGDYMRELEEQGYELQF